ncbi:MAG: hypothetical protein F6J90_22645 [Moorea sp. SIOASIH]|uniref:hypothetical protein n=1 Tax=Moorena sp. SIOASIH TaxID=2607817 RepID=UPI0013B695DB|nr:hypothetical protein [Moorena sp. SIOASIH]NEO38981.1 hypothetical protein [Moorena sp. SIOASIH]
MAVSRLLAEFGSRESGVGSRESGVWEVWEVWGDGEMGRWGDGEMGSEFLSTVPCSLFPIPDFRF